MTTELQFAVIKDELTAMVDDIIRQFLNDKEYDKAQAQSWCNGISDEIIKALHQQQRGFKFVCTCTIFQRIFINELQFNLLMEPQQRRICHR